MRLVIQRVTSAGVCDQLKDGERTAKIGKGLMALVGITHGDTKEDAERCVRKLLGTRFFPHPENGQMWKSNVKDIDGELLLVSQFTLFARVDKGAKPDFHEAMGGEDARPFFESFVEQVKAAYKPDKVQTGIFGGMMAVDLVNDGPTTIIFDTGAGTSRSGLKAAEKPQKPSKATKPQEQQSAKKEEAGAVESAPVADKPSGKAEKKNKAGKGGKGGAGGAGGAVIESPPVDPTAHPLKDHPATRFSTHTGILSSAVYDIVD